MKIRIFYWAVILLSIPLFEACGQSDPTNNSVQTHIHGALTVDASLDPTGDNSEIDLRIFASNPVTGQIDTVFFAQTNRDGEFSGTAQFPRRSLYNMSVSRYGNPLANITLVLAENDTIRIEGTLPQIDETAVIESEENNELTSFSRLERGINRIIALADAGAVSQDTLTTELARWSDLMWDYYQETSHSFAGERAAITSVRLLEGVNDSLMMERISNLTEQGPEFIPVASGLGVQYHLWYNDLDSALVYMDNLANLEMGRQTEMELMMNKVVLLNNNSRTEEALEVFEVFKEEFSDEFVTAQAWADRMEIDLTRLSNGSPMPAFSIETLDGNSLSAESMIGTTYVIEFSTLENTLYQDQYDQSAAIFHIYNNFGVQFISVPLQATEVASEAYFEDSPEQWHIARPGSYSDQTIIQQYNINTLPTRFVVDSEGNIIRKYQGAELDQIISGLRLALNSTGETQ